MSFAVKRLPIYPPEELEAELNKMDADGWTLVQAFEQKAGTGQTGGPQITKKPVSGGQFVTEIRTLATFIFHK